MQKRIKEIDIESILSPSKKRSLIAIKKIKKTLTVHVIKFSFGVEEKEGIEKIVKVKRININVSIAKDKLDFDCRNCEISFFNKRNGFSTEKNLIITLLSIQDKY